MKQYGSKIVFGVPPEMPSVPDGWSLIASPRNWLRAKDPTGELWYVGQDRAYRQINIGGKMRVDMNSYVTLPNAKVRASNEG
jgi:hypothetical protein